jgi:hypothetical protein
MIASFRFIDLAPFISQFVKLAPEPDPEAPPGSSGDPERRRTWKSGAVRPSAGKPMNPI